jgi:hypothetical protein
MLEKEWRCALGEVWIGKETAMQRFSLDRRFCSPVFLRPDARPKPSSGPSTSKFQAR